MMSAMPTLPHPSTWWATLTGPRVAPEDLLPPLTWWEQALRLGAIWALALGYWWLASFTDITLTGLRPEDPETAARYAVWVWTDLAIGQVATLILLCRRKRPLTVALVTGLLGSFSTFAGMVYLYALGSLATHRQVRRILLASLFIPARWFIYQWVGDTVVFHRGEVVWDSIYFLLNLLSTVLLGVVFILLGWNVGVRRALIASWSRQMAAVEGEQTAREAQARVTERNRIARDMHDALGHRLAVVSMHSSALAYRVKPEGEPYAAEEVHAAATTISTQAKGALEDLREIVGVLRADGANADSTVEDGVVAGRVVPTTLAGLPQLVEETSGGATPVELQLPDRLWADALETLPESVSRHAYRVAQEALTNAVKHGDGSPVLMEVGGQPGRGLTMRVVNDIGERGEERPDLGGGGMGLTGMEERVVLAGGRVSAGEQDDRFVVDVWLPWPARRRGA
ncbi:Signal transduction histidine kinase [Kytococcus aerolatus]|uniref:histidine kinase n=2 Tax=Kytococcus aerolatus TaxID=592308 RepID=A0A212T5R7_9MICO|nr:Signal transduction histidine kinase [Kytococcus aerolatus]